MSELKPCPFCGRTRLVRLEAEQRPDRPECSWAPRVVCLDCFGEASSHGFDWTKAEAQKKAIAAWNRRAQPANEPLTLAALTGIKPGSPVLLSMPDKRTIEWKIIKEFDYEDGHNRIKYTDGQYSELATYKIDWLACRHSPEGSESDAMRI